ncbi:MAG: DUF2947 family protein [Planctomycetota bacterium]
MAQPDKLGEHDFLRFSAFRRASALCPSLVVFHRLRVSHLVIFSRGCAINNKTKEIAGVFYNDPKINDDDLEGIFLLEEHECSTLWEQYVSTNNRHFMKLDKGEWPTLIAVTENVLYNCFEDWNNNNIDDFKEILLSLGIPLESPVLFFWMKEVGAKTTWQIFARNWINFLYEDEGCIVVLPEHDCSLILSNGRSWFGATKGHQI